MTAPLFSILSLLDTLMPNTVIMLSALFGLVVSALAIAFGHGSLFLLFSLTLFAGVLIGAMFLD